MMCTMMDVHMHVYVCMSHDVIHECMLRGMVFPQSPKTSRRDLLSRLVGWLVACLVHLLKVTSKNVTPAWATPSEVESLVLKVI